MTVLLFSLRYGQGAVGVMVYYPAAPFNKLVYGYRAAPLVHSLANHLYIVRRVWAPRNYAVHGRIGQGVFSKD